MTVISGMIFKPGSGALVSDEQMSAGVRKYNLAEKLHDYSTPEVAFVAGGSGVADFLNDVHLTVLEYIKANPGMFKTGRQMVDCLGQAFAVNKDKYLNSILQGQFSLGLDEFKSGVFLRRDGSQAPVDRNILNAAGEIVGGRDPRSQFALGNALIALAVDEGSTGLYRFETMLTPFPVAGPYVALGSGYEAADQVISSFLEGMSREARADIDPLSGVSTLLHATSRASAVNNGVGGTPYVTIVDAGKVIRASENNAKLATEIVQANVRGILPEGFVRESLDALLYKNHPFGAVEEQMFKQAKDERALYRMLRGYRQ